MKTVFPFYLIGSCVLENKKHIVHSSYAWIVSKLGSGNRKKEREGDTIITILMISTSQAAFDVLLCVILFSC